MTVGDAAMKRWALLFSLALTSVGAQAQVADSASLVEKMSAPAAQLADSVAGGPGGIEVLAGYDRRASLLHELDDAERINWQFWPAVRIGLSVELMTGQQRLLVHDMLSALLSSSGYLKATTIMRLEQILLDTDLAGFPRAVGHYVLAIFGDPSEEEWAWRFEGHHVSLSVSIAGDDITVTPSFFGSNPAEVRTGPLAGLRVHGRVEDLARELVTSLQGRQRSAAIVADQAPAEIFTAQINVPAERWEAWLSAVEPIGVEVADLNEMQQFWVRQILAEAVNNYAEEIAMQYRDQIDFDSLSFAWMGSTTVGEPHYFRLQGGDFLYEYDNVQNNGNHVHSVWRSKANDFGRDVLADHYLSAAH